MDKSIAKPSIREENERTILAAAEAVFAEQGFGGATMAAIAARAGVPKPNVHYYFPTKERLYRAVVERVLTAWLEAASSFDTSDDPAEALTSYIGAKMDLARTMPLGSQIWASEIMRGAPVIQDFLDTALTQWVRSRERAVKKWIAAGKLKPIEPRVPLLHDLGDDAAIRQRRARNLDAGERPARRRGFRAGQAAGCGDDSGRGGGGVGARRRGAFPASTSANRVETSRRFVAKRVNDPEGDARLGVRGLQNWYAIASVHFYRLAKTASGQLRYDAADRPALFSSDRPGGGQDIVGDIQGRPHRTSPP